MLRVLTLSTLFPDESRPNFGIFVERQTMGLAALPDVSVTVCAPFGLLPSPLSRFAHQSRWRLPQRETWRGLTVHRPRFTVLPGTGGRWHARTLYRALVPALERIHAECPFDVIDTSFFYPDGPTAIALGQRFGVPVSIKARGADIHHWGRSGKTARAVVAAGLAADGLLAVSASMRDDMAAIGIPVERVRIHYTGVDQQRFRPGRRADLKRQLGVDGPLILSIGALIERKRHDVVIDAVAALPGVTLWIAGEGPERARLQTLIRRRGVADRVRLVGTTPHAALPDLVAAADVMALASDSEGLANAWVEALASGTPIVVPDAGGAREVVTSHAAGRLVLRDSLAFAAAIASILADPPSPEAVRTAALPFSWSVNAAGLARHLMELVDRYRVRTGQASRG